MEDINGADIEVRPVIAKARQVAHNSALQLDGMEGACVDLRADASHSQTEPATGVLLEGAGYMSDNEFEVALNAWLEEIESPVEPLSDEAPQEDVSAQAGADRLDDGARRDGDGDPRNEADGGRPASQAEDALLLAGGLWGVFRVTVKRPSAQSKFGGYEVRALSGL